MGFHHLAFFGHIMGALTDLVIQGILCSPALAGEPTLLPAACSSKLRH